MRAGESAFINALRERGVYDSRFASWRHTANRYLDRGEVTVMVTPTPTRKRPSGRPGRQRGFCEMGGDPGLVHDRLGRSQPRSSSAIALLTGRDRQRQYRRSPVRRGWRCLTARNRIGWCTNMLRWTATRYDPDLIEDARRTGRDRQGRRQRSTRQFSRGFARTFAPSSPIARNGRSRLCVRSRALKSYQNPLRSPHRRRPKMCIYEGSARFYGADE